MAKPSHYTWLLTSLMFAALAMGWRVLALAVLYVVCDIWRFRRGTALVLLFGQYALTAYFVSHFFAKPPNALAQVLLPSTAHLCSPNLAKFLTDVCVVLELVAVVALWRRFKTSPRHVTRTQHDRRSDAPRELAHELGDLQRPLTTHLKP